ncbi:hypothetical protein CSPHI_04870 [Corynebacterium sphenisci DSM 44792]|uniref:Uncharacterized protein n=1 Tax=Corynebacterium sphenisci DSM 44792 TaxID=1437874 RepID=A0A1L7CXE4_9CORY|nr:hypothetical protein [Corynebacterium sphenisci]APT90481.1 hypothetical protein CSPHI_04870 [Corynebacterium sphenisci DSM 44792]
MSGREVLHDGGVLAAEVGHAGGVLKPCLQTLRVVVDGEEPVLLIGALRVSDPAELQRLVDAARVAMQGVLPT